MNRAAFYKYLKNSRLLGAVLSPDQVAGINALLDAGAGLPLPHMANVLSQVQRETGGGMYPVKETVFPYSKNRNPTDKQVIARLDKYWATGQLPWVSSAYWRNGMFGRGQIQATHEYNYRKASEWTGIDLVKNPSRALELPVSATIAVEGMKRGGFTGKSLADYDSPTSFDHFGARAVVNGDKNKTDKGSRISVGGQIRKDALVYVKALEAGKWGQPAPTQPKPTQTPWAALFAALASIFGGKA